jgi:hypothetical protein
VPYKPVRLEDIQAKTHTAPRYASPVPPTLQVPPVQPYAVRACEWLCRFRIAINGLYWPLIATSQSRIYCRPKELYCRPRPAAQLLPSPSALVRGAALRCERS